MNNWKVDYLLDISLIESKALKVSYLQGTPNGGWLPGMPLIYQYFCSLNGGQDLH